MKFGISSFPVKISLGTRRPELATNGMTSDTFKFTEADFHGDRNGGFCAISKIRGSEDSTFPTFTASELITLLQAAEVSFVDRIEFQNQLFEVEIGTNAFSQVNYDEISDDGSISSSHIAVAV